MREKLLVLMKNEGLTSSRLAELLGIQPSGISHILGGRNKPSFDFVQKVLRRFPRLNPDWLLLDSEQMYRDLTTEDSQPAENSIFSAELTFAPEDAKNDEPASPVKQSEMATVNGVVNTAAQNALTRGNIKRIIILYDDRSFESYDIAK